MFPTDKFSPTINKKIKHRIARAADNSIKPIKEGKHTQPKGEAINKNKNTTSITATKQPVSQPKSDAEKIPPLDIQVEIPTKMSEKRTEEKKRARAYRESQAKKIRG